MKKERIREKTLADLKRAKQATFDNLPKTADAPKAKPEKSIVIQLTHAAKEDELDLAISFRLLPSRMHFSNLQLDLHFDGDKVNTYRVAIPPSRLLSDELEFPIALDMTGISAGEHVIKVELSEKWMTGEVLAYASEYVVVQYSPVRKEDRYVKVPLVRKIDGAFRIVLPEEKELYDALEKGNREEANAKRDKY
ncbi:hypothetical protein GX563_09210 [Candidatus Bathyarchaeota archaeon]|nr:hypothetical protein [Candidatus Bathyarchaeota archaeon]